MFVVTFTNILALFFPLLDSRRILKNGLAFGFVIITVIACIRYNYGNDYMSYMRDFERVGQYSLSYIFENQEQLQYSDALFKDIGAVTLFRLFHPLGFFFFAGLISAIQGCIYYQFITENVKREYYWLAFFLYVFQVEYYVLPMSMIRQGFVIALYVWAWHFLKKEKTVIPLLISVICISIHKSAVVFLPFILIVRYVPLNNGKVITGALLISLCVMLGSSVLVNSIFETIAEAEVFKIYIDSYSTDVSNGIGGIRLILNFLPFILALNYIRKKNVPERSRVLVILSTIGVLILPFTTIIALISRVCYYFNIFSIAAIPLTLNAIKNPALRYSFMSIIIIVTAYQYYDFFHDPIYTNFFMEYKTVFNTI